MQRLIGLLVGAVFGMLFVAINATEPLPSVVGTLLRVAAILALMFVIYVYLVVGKLTRNGAASPGGPMFGRAYLVIVAVEAVLLFGGLPVLGALGVPEQVNVAWIAFVVGAHFIALAPVWKAPSMLVPGVVPAVLGIAGFVMAATSAIAWVPFVSGVLSGVTLLGASAVLSWKHLAELRAAPTPPKAA